MKKLWDKLWKNKPLRYFILLLLIIGLTIGLDNVGGGYKSPSLKYSDFMSLATEGKVSYVELENSSDFIKVFVKDTNEANETIEKEETIINPGYKEFYKEMSEIGVDVRVKKKTALLIIISLLDLLPLILIFLLFASIFKMSFSKGFSNKVSSKLDSDMLKTKFEHVAGLTEEKEELKLAIEMLKNPKLCDELGIRPTKGVLLEGSPGVGKTLLAKAVAGEAGVGFYSISGSELVEVYVGLGASRVRQLYKEASKSTPCVIFIDEIDAIGGKRDEISGGGSSEFASTLNALLEKMDGVKSTDGILFIGATNRINTLDQALLRPGRFDKIIHIDIPKTKEDREAIVTVHLKGKKVEEGVTLSDIGKQCFGLSGAEIEEALNDAVLISYRDNRNGILNLNDIDRAVMQLATRGLAKGKHSDRDIKRVAVHEMGHALMNKHLGNRVVKVSIQPYSSGVGGVTMIDGDDSNLTGLRTKQDLYNDIKILYSGMIAEKVILGEVSTGASNDLKRATKLIYDMVNVYGLGETNLLVFDDLINEKRILYSQDKLREDMTKIAEDLAKEVTAYFSDEGVREKLLKYVDKLIEEEVIYSLE